VPLIGSSEIRDASALSIDVLDIDAKTSAMR
jgi:hypothetical protein